MKIAALSDTHGHHRSVEIPSHTDLILFAGDITNQGEKHILRDFNTWIGELRTPFICIAGNHDLSLEGSYHLGKQILFNTTYLEHELTEFQGLKIFGSPYAPRVGRWAFGLNKDQAKHKWSQIPEETDILLTHGPMRGVQDWYYCDRNKKLGCSVLRKEIGRVKPKIHIYGHIHEGYGSQPHRLTASYNVSICTWPSMKPMNPPTVIEI